MPGLGLHGFARLAGDSVDDFSAPTSVAIVPALGRSVSERLAVTCAMAPHTHGCHAAKYLHQCSSSSLRGRTPTSLYGVFSYGGQLIRSMDPEGTTQYEGIKRRKGFGNVFGRPPRTAESWSSVAYQAYLRALEARNTASLAAEDAQKHELIAQSAASQARVAQVQMERASRASFEHAPGIKRLKLFCTQIRKRLQKHPKEANDLAMLELRKFCGALDAQLDVKTRAGAESGPDMGFLTYATPPEDYPQTPIWPEAVPTWKAPLVEGCVPPLVAALFSPPPVLPKGGDSDFL